MEKEQYGVHQTHCCVLHGCKYGDEDCPVTNKVINQTYACYDCYEEGISAKAVTSGSPIHSTVKVFVDTKNIESPFVFMVDGYITAPLLTQLDTTVKNDLKKQVKKANTAKSHLKVGAVLMRDDMQYLLEVSEMIPWELMEPINS